MKHVPRLRAEPSPLAEYRRDHPTDATADGQDATTAWTGFRDDPSYQELRSELVRLQQGLCGYCERRLTHPDGQLVGANQQIEHVLPKSSGHGRVLDWTNFMLCCAGNAFQHVLDRPKGRQRRNNISCGQHKEDQQLPAGCDPRDFPFLSRLTDVGIDGVISANYSACVEHGISPQDLEHALNKILNLNCESLRKARQEIVGNIVGEVLWLVEMLKSRLDLDREREQQFVDLIAHGCLAPDSHGHLRSFWTTERQYLEPWSSLWLSRNANLFLANDES
jgi:uncharacterized protein (TIGR02646 family)